MLPERATTPEAMKAMLARIKAKKDPLTEEGVVIDNTYKYKIRPDSTGYFLGTFPGTGRRLKSIGGILYTTTEGGLEPVGKIGSGFTNQDLLDIAANVDKYKSRAFRFTHRGQLPSGNYREPSFGGWETDKGPDIVEGMPDALPKVASTIPLVFSEPDAEIPGAGPHTLITGLIGSGKTTTMKDEYGKHKQTSLDSFFPKGYETMEEVGLKDKLKKILARKKPQAVEGVQLPDLRDVEGVNEQTWRIKRVSFLKSMLQQWKRSHGDDFTDRVSYLFKNMPINWRLRGRINEEFDDQMPKKATMEKEIPAEAVPLSIAGPDGKEKALVKAEMATTPSKRRRGLAYRDTLEKDAAMFFDIPGPFWMRGTRFDLDIAFLDKGGKILGLDTMKKASLDSHYPPPGAVYALELPAGFMAKKGLFKGCKVALKAA